MKKHDKIYTVVLIVTAFWWLISVGVMQMTLSSTPIGKLITLIYSALFVITAITAALRLWKPEVGKIVTIALNCILLIAFPFGTAIAIYGFWKVGKERGEDAQPTSAGDDETSAPEK